MVLVKILGFIDLISSTILFSMIFSISIPFQIVTFTGSLLFVKSLFILRGDFLSAVDLFAAIVMFIGIFFTPWAFIMWLLSLLLMSKAVASFL